MKKNKSLILNTLKEAMIKEELAVPLYASHITQTLFWSGLPEKKQQKIIAGLKVLEIESGHHALAFKKIMDTYSNL